MRTDFLDCASAEHERGFDGIQGLFPAAAAAATFRESNKMTIKNHTILR